MLSLQNIVISQCVLVGVSHVESIERTKLVIDLLELGRYRGYRGDELSSGLRKSMDHSNKRELRNLLDHRFQSGNLNSEEIDVPWILKSK